MVKKLTFALLSVGVLLTFGFAASTYAITPGPVSLQNGFPIWYEDDAGRRAEFCLDAACLPDPVIAGDPFSQQIGFGAEAFYWIAGAVDPGNPAGLFLVEFAMEAAWAAEVPNPGDQFPFTRVRIRIDTPGDGDVVITHPFGVTTVNVPAGAGGGAGAEVNVSFDIPGAPPVFVIPPPGAGQAQPTHFFAIDGTVPVPGQAFSGTGTIANAGTANAIVTVIGAGLNLSTDLFDAAGRLFEDAAAPLPNVAPIANPDVVSVLFGSVASIDIDAVANDTDVLQAGVNERVINPVATGLGAAAPFVIDPITPFTTAQGGQVLKNPDGTFTYTPTPTFVGEDTFTYAVQDTGGLISTALVTVVVENAVVTEAVFRPKIGKWRIAGTTSDTTANTMTIRDGAGPTAPVLGTAAVGADGSWVFEGKSTVSPGAQGLTITTSNGISLTGFPVAFR